MRLAMLVLFAASLSAHASQTADRIVILKSKRTLILYSDGKELKSYKVALGGQPIGPKSRQGDHRTPEGIYRIDSKNAHSRFHKALHISYPNQQDRLRARELGVSPGGDIMIHGLPDAYAYLGPLHRQHDWTEGCIAVTNSEIEEIWTLVQIGTEIEIRP